MVCRIALQQVQQLEGSGPHVEALGQRCTTAVLGSWVSKGHESVTRLWLGQHLCLDAGVGAVVAVAVAVACIGMFVSAGLYRYSTLLTMNLYEASKISCSTFSRDTPSCQA